MVRYYNWTPVIISSAVFAASTLVTAGTTSFSKRATTIYSACPMDNTTWTGEVFTSFTGIIFNDFTAGSVDNDTQEIAGRLGVGGRFTALNYYVNNERQVDCSVGTMTTFSDYGLTVIGDAIARDVYVNGNVVVLGSGNTVSSGIHELADGCEIFTKLQYGERPIRIAQDSAISASFALARANPQYHMDATGKITKRVDDPDNTFAFFTFEPCITFGSSCGQIDILSDPTGFLLNSDNVYQGLSGDIPPESLTMVFNIPIASGATLNITNDMISSGLSGCRTIFNFYPIDSEGNYAYTGTSSFHRDISGTLPGFTLAPRVEIIDGTSGNFAGQIIADSYRWESNHMGPSILGYDECSTFQGCFPLKEYELNSTVTVTVTEPIKTESKGGVPTVYAVPFTEEYNEKKWGDKNEWNSGWENGSDRKKFDYSYDKGHPRKGDEEDDEEGW